MRYSNDDLSCKIVINVNNFFNHHNSFGKYRNNGDKKAIYSENILHGKKAIYDNVVCLLSYLFISLILIIRYFVCLKLLVYF